MHTGDEDDDLRPTADARQLNNSTHVCHHKATRDELQLYSPRQPAALARMPRPAAPRRFLGRSLLLREKLLDDGELHTLACRDEGSERFRRPVVGSTR